MKSPNVLFIRELTPFNYENPVFCHPVLQELEDNGFFSDKHFTFVGVYYSVKTNTTVIGYPKYMPKYKEGSDALQIIHHVNLVCKVIGKAQQYLKKSLFENTYNFDSYNSNLQKQYVNRYDLAVNILQDYMAYGIYYNKSKQKKRNGRGNILWQRTIQTVNPIINREDVLYLESVNLQNHQDYSQLVTHLHIWIINRCARLLQIIGQCQDLELPEVKLTFDDAYLEQYVPYLLSKLSTVFFDREIRLIKSLAAWCGQSSFYRNQIGITSFDRIWEYATKQVFGNIDDTRSGPPSYYIDNQEYIARGDAIPDILRVFMHQNTKKGIIGILDAKYYCPQIKKHEYEIYGVPANSDIAKQIGYYHYMKQQYCSDSFKFTNAFLFPSLFESNSNLFRRIGFARPNNKRYDEVDRLLEGITVEESTEQDRVLLYKVDAEALFEACLNEVKVDDETFYKYFVIPFYANNE